jgi:sugar (pentulose or hexulose) kinase
VQPIPAILVFDIGKTNKKILVFDTSYLILFEESQHLEQTIDDDGDPCEDIQRLTQWLKDSFERILAAPNWYIKAVNVSAYGASLVHLGKNGQPVAPLYNYLKPLRPDIAKAFHEASPALFTQTASPDLGNLNSGVLLYMIKKAKPELFGNISLSMHLPQYASYVLTGKRYSDLTSLGCHTAMWDFRLSDYHRWVDAEGLRPLLAPLQRSDAVTELKRGRRIIYSGIGLHDSSAALIPYLLGSPDPFCLLSTGTWCISLNPFNENPLTNAELAQDCLCYLSFTGRPVKASRLFSGHFHDQQVAEIAKAFGVPDDFFKQLDPVKLLAGKTGIPKRDIAMPFELFDPSAFPDAKTAYLYLMEELVARQSSSTKLVLSDNVKKIYVDGGFGMNTLFMMLLSKAFPSHEVSAASVAQASALGAALAIHNAWNREPIEKGLLKLKRW